MTVAHRPLRYRVLPVLRAENTEVLIHPDDRKFGALLVGSMGSGKTAAMLRMYLNDLRDVDAAIIIMDPKSELSRLCLSLTPPDCPKRVWFLDLGHPAFGMSPLRLTGDGPLPIQAAAIAENVVAALLDINENQIFQSSRRYLYHAVIGAIAIAERQERRAKFEDVYSLLLPMKEDFRGAVAEACADQPDLDQTAEFFRSELPDDLRMAGSAVAQRLDAPRNKVAGLTGVPPLRRFFNHPTDISLREILEARDVLIVDANMGAIGEDNSKACMHFLLRTLHSQMQRQVHLPETDRPRVPLLVDEAHYVAGAENVVDQIATHRRAGLETSFGLQYFAQLGSGSQHEEKIRKGVLNLLQSRFLFRMGDAQDAEEATRIAMAVYSTMIRDDPDSRARLRVTPEQALNFPNHHCLASWIAMGSRIPSFMGQTYAFPPHSNAWAEHHLADLAARVAPYPDDLESTLDRSTLRPTADHDGRDAPPSANGKGDKRRRARVASASAASASDEAPAPRQTERSPIGRSAPASPTSSSPSNDDEPVAPPGPSASGSVRHEVRVDYEAPPAVPNVADSPVRRLVGRKTPGAPGRARDDVVAPDSLRELAFLDRVNEIGPPQQLDGAAKLPRMFNEDYSILALLDRAGLAPRSLIGRAVLPGRGANAVIKPTHQALPPRADRPAHHRNPRALAHRRKTTAAVLDHPPRAGGRPGARTRRRRSRPSASGGQSSSAAPPGCHTTCTHSGGRSSSTASSGRSPPTAGARPVTPPAATPSRRSVQANAVTRSPSTRSRCQTAKRSSTSSSRRSARSSPTCRSSCASTR